MAGGAPIRAMQLFEEKRMSNLSFVKRMTALAMALMFLVASNVMRVEATPANNLTPEQVEAIVRNMYDKFTAFDAQGTTDCFALDGTIEDSVGTTPIQGTQAILAYEQSFSTVLDEIRFQSVDITVGGQSKFGQRLRSRTLTAQINEALCKVLCHNLCCVIQSVHELGIETNFEVESAIGPPRRRAAAAGLC